MLNVFLQVDMFTILAVDLEDPIKVIMGHDGEEGGKLL